VAVAVNPSFDYVIIKHQKAHLLLAEALLGTLANKLGIEVPEVVERKKGKELEQGC